MKTTNRAWYPGCYERNKVCYFHLRLASLWNVGVIVCLALSPYPAGTPGEEDVSLRPELCPFYPLDGLSTGYINTKGEVVIPPIYFYGTDFENGAATVTTTRGSFVYSGSRSVLDGRGNWLVAPAPLGMRSFQRFKNGFISVRDESGERFMDSRGNVVFENHFDEISIICGTKHFAFLQNGKWGVINTKGEVVIPPEHDYRPEFHNDIIVLSNRHPGYPDAGDGMEIPIASLVDENGAIISENRYLTIRNGGEGLFVVAGESSFRFGFIDGSGKEVIPPQYAAVGGFSEGLSAAAVISPERKKQIWGYIDRQGGYIIEPRFTEAGKFSEGLAAVAVDGGNEGDGAVRWGYIDKRGEFVIPPLFESANAFLDGGAVVMRDGKFGVIDSNGDTVVPFEYYSIDYKAPGFRALAFDGPVSYLRFEDDYDFYLVSGEKFDVYRAFANGLTLKVQNGEGGYFNASGEMVLGMTYHKQVHNGRRSYSRVVTYLHGDGSSFRGAKEKEEGETVE